MHPFGAAVNWLVDAQDLPLLLVAGWHLAVHDLALDELSLQVGGNEVHRANPAAVSGGVRAKGAAGAGAEVARVRLVVVITFDEGAALHAQTGFGGAVALLLVHPHEFVQAPTGGQL